MAYHGNAAYQLDVYGQAQAIPSRRPLSVHEGGGLDARARSERSARVAPLVGVVVALTLALAIVGALRVAITAQTVRLLGEVSIAE